MSADRARFIKLRGDKGLTILQSPDDISTILYEWRKGQGPRLAGPAIYLLLNNNNRVEVVGETVESLLAKLSTAQGMPTIVYDDTGPLTGSLEPQPEEETTDA